MKTAPRFAIAALAAVLILASKTAGQDITSQSIYVVAESPGTSQSAQRSQDATSLQSGVSVRVSAGHGTDVDELRQLDATVDGMARTGELVVTSRRADRTLAGRTHEYLVQTFAGIPVHGGGVSRQFVEGVTVSIFGTLHSGIDLDPVPRLSPGEALDVIERRAGAGPATSDPPALVILPHALTLRGGYILAYRATMRDLHTYFLNAHSGEVVHAEREVQEQGAAAVGVGIGIVNDRKKVSTSQAGGSFQAYDRLRPAEIVTLDLRYNEDRADRLVDPRGLTWLPSDVASDTDNTWDDPAVVDGHAHMGFTYDYLASRHGWSGMDGRDGRILGMVNIEARYSNAFFARPPAGPEGTGVVAFGEENDGTPIVSADVVAHEIMHGVTYFSVAARTGDGFRNSVDAILGPSSFRHEDGRRFRCGAYVFFRSGPLVGRRFPYICEGGRFLLFMNHGGAINEAYSDIIGTAVEFSLQIPGTGPNRADYVMFEDTGPPSRSLENPRSIALAGQGTLRYPDAFGAGVRFLVASDGEYTFFSHRGSVDGRTIVRLPTFGYSGVHWNSTILSHAFYLAVEGGRNATTGRTVEGVGGANRAQIERIFFRAMTDLMPGVTLFQQAADVIRQSAADLAAGEPPQRAVDQALRAVGL